MYEEIFPSQLKMHFQNQLHLQINNKVRISQLFSNNNNAYDKINVHQLVVEAAYEIISINKKKLMWTRRGTTIGRFVSLNLFWLR